LCFIKVKLSVEVRRLVSLLSVAYVHFAWIPEMTDTVSSGTLNPTHSLTVKFRQV